ncbi:21409_t:CDS:2, partial [Racocetra persica]
ETQSELEKLKQERMQICTQADKNSETNSSILDKILDKMGEWIISLQNWAFADEYSIKLWKEKAENTFKPEIARKKVKRVKKMSITKEKKFLAANNSLAHNDDENPVDNDKDLTDDDDK